MNDVRLGLVLALLVTTGAVLADVTSDVVVCVGASVGCWFVDPIAEAGVGVDFFSVTAVAVCPDGFHGLNTLPRDTCCDWLLRCCDDVTFEVVGFDFDVEIF